MNQREQREMSDDLKIEMRLSNDQLSCLEDLIKTSLKQGQELQDEITELSNQQGQQQQKELRKEKKVEETKSWEWNKEKAAMKDSPWYKELQDLTKGLHVNKQCPLTSPVKENVQSPYLLSMKSRFWHYSEITCLIRWELYQLHYHQPRTILQLCQGYHWTTAFSTIPNSQPAQWWIPNVWEYQLGCIWHVDCWRLCHQQHSADWPLRSQPDLVIIIHFAMGTIYWIVVYTPGTVVTCFATIAS